MLEGVSTTLPSPGRDSTSSSGSRWGHGLHAIFKEKRPDELAITLLLFVVFIATKCPLLIIVACLLGNLLGIKGYNGMFKGLKDTKKEHVQHVQDKRGDGFPEYQS